MERERACRGKQLRGLGIWSCTWGGGDLSLAAQVSHTAQESLRFLSPAASITQLWSHAHVCAALQGCASVFVSVRLVHNPSARVCV